MKSLLSLCKTFAYQRFQICNICVNSKKVLSEKKNNPFSLVEGMLLEVDNTLIILNFQEAIVI